MLRKQAVLGQAQQNSSNHHLGAVQEDELASGMQECSRLSLDHSSTGTGSASALRHKVTLGSWDSYWDSRQDVEVPGRYDNERLLTQHNAQTEDSKHSSSTVNQQRTPACVVDRVNTHAHAHRGTFTTYMAGSSGAVVYCLHGGGYTGLTWSLVATQLKQQ